MRIVIDGKNTEIAATGRNDSKQFIERAEFCLSPPEDHNRCFYRFLEIQLDGWRGCHLGRTRPSLRRVAKL